MEKDKKDYQYLTIYNKDYTKKPPKGQVKYRSKQEFGDPVAEAFKDYLDVDKKEYPPLIEDADMFLDKVKGERQKIGRMYFDTPINHEYLYDNRIMNGKTEYQIGYCDIKADIRQREQQIEDRLKARLPEDIVIPLTTQKYAYRNPTDLSANALERPPVRRPANNLGQDEVVNEILNVTTGDSEYGAVIGKLGEFVVEHQMHGKIDHDN